MNAPDHYTRENHPCRRQEDILESCKARFLSWEHIAPWLIGGLWALIGGAGWVVWLWLSTIAPIQNRQDNHESRIGKMEVEWGRAIPKLDTLIPAVKHVETLLMEARKRDAR